MKKENAAPSVIIGRGSAILYRAFVAVGGKL
jgi:hypothetical protein